MLLDPYYRTLRGFQVIIEKEWLSFGHKFNVRCGQGERNYWDDQRSPVFIQFLDCVHQILVQFPCAFEFNEHYVVTIMEHVFSCRFGTFLTNNEKERSDIRSSTPSLWTYLEGIIQSSDYHEFLNPHYTYSSTPIFPDCSATRLLLWQNLFLRQRIHESQSNALTLSECGMNLRVKCDDLRQQLQDAMIENEVLKKRVAELEVSLGNDKEDDDDDE
eukprot:TRINITY_DN14102_c0_g1_i1.p1 TRINITY_DN14102_c0_g1~~TRINITY_DN14102_c0_g1_i1.p1  ORF type:complete len:216 (+),score=50.44 TRINITY_DN14102_c0_g1_i1:254-901(+)